jgi:MFS family permease
MAIARTASRGYAPLAMLSAFGSRNYALFWAGSFVSNVGTWMQSVALGWLIYEMTGAASWLGMVSFAANAPALFIGLIGGAVADRADRRVLLVGTQVAAAVSALLLGVLTARGVLEVWQVIVVALAAGSVQSLYTPVVQATIPSLVPIENLLSAVSLNSVQFNLARILGPLVAGFAYGAIGAAGCFFLNGFSFFVLALALSRLRLPPRTFVADGSIAKQLVDGLRYARSQPLISTLLVFAAAVSLMGFPYIILMPAVAHDTLRLGPAGLGLMMGCVGLGAVVGGLALAALGDVPRKALLAVAAGVMLAVMLVAFSLTTTLRAAAPFLFLLGVMQVGCAASLNATLQLTVTEAMRGRVMSMLGFAYFGLSTLGSVLFGLIGDRIGVAVALRLGGIAILAVAALILVRSRSVLSTV